jgi:hypothetical protein
MSQLILAESLNSWLHRRADLAWEDQIVIRCTRLTYVGHLIVEVHIGPKEVKCLALA